MTLPVDGLTQIISGLDRPDLNSLESPPIGSSSLLQGGNGFA